MQTVQQQLAGLKLSGVQAALTLQQQQPVGLTDKDIERITDLALMHLVS